MICIRVFFSERQEWLNCFASLVYYSRQTVRPVPGERRENAMVDGRSGLVRRLLHAESLFYSERDDEGNIEETARSIMTHDALMDLWRRRRGETFELTRQCTNGMHVNDAGTSIGHHRRYAESGSRVLVRMIVSNRLEDDRQVRIASTGVRNGALEVNSYTDGDAVVGERIKAHGWGVRRTT